MFIIDTLEFSKKLEKSGMIKEVAETLAEEIKSSQLKSDEVLATKRDIQSFRSEIKSEIVLVRQEIKNAMLTTIVSLGAIIALLEKFIN